LRKGDEAIRQTVSVWWRGGGEEREEEGRRKGREPQGDDAVGGRKSDEGWKERLALP